MRIHNQPPGTFQGLASKCAKVTKHGPVSHEQNHVANELDMDSMEEFLQHGFCREQTLLAELAVAGDSWHLFSYCASCTLGGGDSLKTIRQLVPSLEQAPQEKRNWQGRCQELRLRSSFPPLFSAPAARQLGPA